jgi:outer membrane protein assembly factor BamB
MRRPFPRSWVALLLSLSALASQAAAGPAPSPMFRGDPAHAGVSAAVLFGGQGGVVWRHPTEGAIRSTPAVTARRIYVGSGDGGLYAVDRATGRTVWRFAAGDPVTASPAVAGGLVVAATHGGRLFAVDEETGRLRWSRRTGAALPFNTYPAGAWDVWASSPTVTGATVVIGGADGMIYALDLATGKARWAFRTGGRVRATPAVADGTVIVGSWDGRVYALDLATGQERWVHRTIGDTLDSGKFGFDRRALQSSPAIAEGRVFVGSRDGGLYALDARTGKREWRASHRGSWVVGSPAVKDGTVYVGSSDGQFVQAVDAATGTERWRFETRANVLSSPVLVRNLVIVGTEANDSPWGDLLALEAATGKLRWRIRCEEALYSSPVAVDSMLYVGTDAGDLLAIGETNPAIPRLAVYYDSALAQRGTMPGARLAREYFAGLGYDVLGADSLRAFFEARIQDGLPSVVVFALDALPASVLADTGSAGIWRRFLEAGGKIVWLGVLPGTQVFDSTGRFLGNDLPLSAPLTGLMVDSTDWNEYPSVPTPEGRRWGLSGHWRGDMPTAPSVVSRVLALDSDGWATAWQIQYRGDRPWAGYVQLWGLGATVERLPMIRAATEYGLLRRWAGS